MKRIAILGSTGSIGTQTLDVIKNNRHIFEVEVLTANNNSELLINQAKEFNPKYVVIGNQSQYDTVKESLSKFKIEVLFGQDAIAEIVKLQSIDLVLVAMVGFSGLKPTLNAIQAGKNIALANKETLVVAGDLICKLQKSHDVKILPVDSEHSAIFQCLVGEADNKIEKIILTASGGPFRDFDLDRIKEATPKQALNHPNWSMGSKITIDSATLMNKGFEAIEAKWLFELQPKQIEVVIHPQSIVHSLVQFEDGSIKAQLGLPDMRLPIQYALTYPLRLKMDHPRFNFMDYPQLNFTTPNYKNFRNLGLAFAAMETGGNAPCVLNASNEIAVNAFLNHQIGFLEMSDIVEKCMNKVVFQTFTEYDQYLETDHFVRKYASELIN